MYISECEMKGSREERPIKGYFIESRDVKSLKDETMEKWEWTDDQKCEGKWREDVGCKYAHTFNSFHIRNNYDRKSASRKRKQKGSNRVDIFERVIHKESDKFYYWRNKSLKGQIFLAY